MAYTPIKGVARQMGAEIHMKRRLQDFRHTYLIDQKTAGHLTEEQYRTEVLKVHDRYDPSIKAACRAIIDSEWEPDQEP